MKMKRGIAVWYNILFYCNVHSLNYISAAINMFRWKRRGSGVWYHISSYCKYSEGNCSSQGELTDVIKYAALSRITGLVSSRPLEFTPQVELAKSELPRTKSEISILGIEKHQQVWGKKNSWYKLFQVISVEKWLILWELNVPTSIVIPYIYLKGTFGPHGENSI